MSDTSGLTSRTPFASYDPDSSASRTWQVMSLWGWTSYSETWPRSGMTRGGDAYELPTLAPPTPASECSSLLPTPTVNDMGAGKTVEAWDEWTARMKVKHGNGNGHGPSLSIEALRLLPTPKAQDYRDSDSPAEARRNSPALTVVSVYFPTPMASDASGNGMHPSTRVGRTQQLIDAVLGLSGAPTPPLFDVGSDLLGPPQRPPCSTGTGDRSSTRRLPSG